MHHWRPDEVLFRGERIKETAPTRLACLSGKLWKRGIFFSGNVLHARDNILPQISVDWVGCLSK